MNLFVGLTDHDWYSYLLERRPDEVNFWWPSGATGFQALQPGEPFLFKAKAPHSAIIGGGYFDRYVRAPVSLAWQAFGENNGAPDMGSLLQRVGKYRREMSPDPEIGCTLLVEPFFFPADLWVEPPSDWSRPIVRGKRYSTSEEIGASLWDAVVARIADPRTVIGPDALSVAGEFPTSGDRFGSPFLTRSRLGQGTFRLGVLDAYQKRCAVTGERVVPVLEAAHIRPYADRGPHAIDNGLSLRADIHRLFDLGYVTVDPSLKFRVSSLLDREYDNGKNYYHYQGKELAVLPTRPHDRPASEYLEWHSDVRFRP